MLIGILSGLLAGAFWGFVFLVPHVLTGYTAADVALGRYVVFGLLSAGVLLRQARKVRAVMTLRLAWWALGLSCLSFSVYYFSLALSVKYSGAIPATLFSGLLPITIPLCTRDKVVRRGLFVVSLGLILLGLALLYSPLLETLVSRGLSSANELWGMVLAVFAVCLWTAYAPLNARVLAKHPEIDATVWTSVLGVFAFVTMAPLWFFGRAVQGVPVDTVSSAGFASLSFWGWMLVIGVGSSWLATSLWNFAARRIPTALAGQLIVSEAVFSLIYTFLYEGRWPMSYEWGAAFFLIIGVMAGIRSFTPKNASVVM